MDTYTANKVEKEQLLGQFLSRYFIDSWSGVANYGRLILGILCIFLNKDLIQVKFKVIIESIQARFKPILARQYIVSVDDFYGNKSFAYRNRSTKLDADGTFTFNGLDNTHGPRNILTLILQSNAMGQMYGKEKVISDYYIDKIHWFFSSLPIRIFALAFFESCACLTSVETLVELRNFSS